MAPFFMSSERAARCETKCVVPLANGWSDLNGWRMKIFPFRSGMCSVLFGGDVWSGGEAQGVGPAVRSQGAPAAPKQSAPVTQRPTSTPYTGDLSIFDYPDRDKKLQIDRVMDLLGISAGKNVADIGAGSGWFTVRAARRVGPTGAVLAEDINPLSIQYIGKRVRKEDLSNVRTVLGSADDPRLPAGSVDAVLMLKVYHEIAHPAALRRH